MADQRGTLERLAEEVGLALAPLEELLSPENLPRLFIELGLDSAPDLSGNQAFSQQVAAAAQAALALEDGVAAMFGAVDGNDAGKTVVAAQQIVTGIAALTAALDRAAAGL